MKVWEKINFFEQLSQPSSDKKSKTGQEPKSKVTDVSAGLNQSKVAFTGEKIIAEGRKVTQLSESQQIQEIAQEVWSDLPSEILFAVVDYLDPKSTVALMLVNHHMKEIVKGHKGLAKSSKEFAQTSLIKELIDIVKSSTH